jgi:succinoglycan biosynthesis protein ExoL
MGVKILYFVHDLYDPAITRRIGMFQAGGAEVAVAGFQRLPALVSSVSGAAAISLGRTEPAKLVSRAWSVATAALDLSGIAKPARDATVIVARNLEMLALAVSARNRYAPAAPIAYECLDIHRLLLSGSAAGRALRFIEDRLWRQTDLLLTSSQAFASNYFKKRGFPAPIRLVENKVLDLSGRAPPDQVARPPARPPWRIGWFGALRCRKSFEILAGLTRDLPGLVEIVMRGLPAPSIFPDLEAEAAQTPGMTFAGAYKNPDDLAAIYGGVHFAWALDYYEKDQNSAWLLPNRIYEGSLWGAVPIALSGVETGRWLAARGAGLLLPDPPAEALASFFLSLDGETYARLTAATANIPRADLLDSAASCRALVAALPLERRREGARMSQLQTPMSGPA